MATILVIDDERMIGDLLRATLTRHGHDIIVATSGREGLEQFQQHGPHVTLVDWHMPEIDGLEVLKQIRTLDPQAAVMMVTGEGTETLENQARQLGVTDFLRKGLSLTALLGALERVLQKPTPRPGTRAAASSCASAEPARASILVVDDEALITCLLAQFLSRRGYRVRTVANGPEALALVEQECPQMIVLDMYMPGMNGLEVFRALRARAYPNGVLALTAAQDDKLLKEVLELGAVDVLAKPVKLDRLAEVIQVGLMLSAR